MAGSIFDDLRGGVKSDQEIAISALFPTKDNFKMLQMITDLPLRAVMPLSVLGVFRRRYKSDILKMYQEEYSLNRVASERKGRLELGEIVGAIRRGTGEEDE